MNLRLFIIGCLIAGVFFLATPTEAKAPSKNWEPLPERLFTSFTEDSFKEVIRDVPEPSVEPRSAPKPTKAPPTTSPKKYAFNRIGYRQFACLDKLWTRESNWNHRARNRHSGAYGIPQALPGSKMASAGADWRTNPITQVRWGLRYIDGRYGTACNAWRFWQSHHWY